MDDVDDEDHGLLLALVAELVSAYVSKNAIDIADLPDLISNTHGALKSLGSGDVEPQIDLKPAVPIKKSITPDFLICLDDGKQFKSMKRHLKGLGMTPQEYRDKWGLPADYPMVAPNYSAKRTALALASGLGRQRPK